MKKQPLRLRTVGPAAALLCELLGLASLALTPDVERPLFLAPVALGAMAWVARVSIPDRVLLFLVAALIFGGYLSAGHEATGTILARSLIPAHALLWLAADERTYRFWRLGVALLELVLAAILAPEAQMFVLIFFFVLFSSLALSLGFIEKKFRERDPESLDRPIRGAFVGSVLALSCVIFLSSLVIFPLLPRSRWNGNGGETSTGYNDVVTYQQGILSWGKADSRPVAWIFREPDQSWETLLPYLLLRGQALERFDGHVWRSLPGAYVPSKLPAVEQGVIEMSRQSLATDVLPVPYGTLDVTVGTEYGEGRMSAGEWIAHGGRMRSLRYQVRYGRFRTDEYGAAPPAADSAFDANLFPGITKLAGRLKPRAASGDAQIASVLSFFRSGGFTSELRPVKPYRPGAPHPIEDFLFREKSGHCELFAASTVLLLRAMGLPARLVVGFRARPPSHGNVLTVRASDAHAWAEVWTPGRGWRALDTTPSSSEPGWVSDAFDELTGWVGAYWSRYILEYEFDPEALLNAASSFVGLASAILLVVGLLLFVRGRRLFGTPKSNRDLLAPILERFEDDLIHRAGIFPGQAYRDIPDARDWRLRYSELRFGPVAPTRTDVKQMRRTARRLVAISAAALRSDV